jgi:transcriptional regulator with XRE-family HTH domain
MPRKHSLPEPEKAICRRLREFRLDTKLSRVAFAKELRIDSSRLAAYEHARVPLRFVVVREIAMRFRLNPGWLADGDGPMRELITMGWWEGARPPEKELFSVGFERIRKDVEYQVAMMKSMRGLGAMAPSIEKIQALFHLHPEALPGLIGSALTRDLESLPDASYPAIVRALAEVIAPFLQKGPPTAVEDAGTPHGSGSAGHSDASPPAAVQAVDCDVLTSFNRDSSLSPTVRQPIESWPELRERLKRLTTQRGDRSALARKFKVTSSAVSEWMRGKNMPSADLTLRLSAWVTTEEAKLKSPAVAPAPEAKAPFKGTKRGTKTKGPGKRRSKTDDAGTGAR